MNCRISLGALVLLALAYVAPAAASAVQTESGLLQGVDENGALVFKGIPFAAPPVGDLRWRAPRPAAPWSGVRTADRFAPVCPQDGAYPPESPPETWSEDCLYLNVWKPRDARAAKLPIMVWIHGGGLSNGSASTPLYWGDRLVQRDVIVVTANYRLGVLGFLAHPELTKEAGHAASGNYGLLDQIAVLTWVHRNIAAFGGDPGNVTVFGQSSGSISISALVTSPLARGLFQRAIGQSGGLFEPMELDPGFTLAGAEREGQDYARRAGAETVSALRDKSAAELVKVPANAHLIIDGFALPRTPYDTYRANEQNDVALLVGSNADEGQLFIADRTVTTENFRAELNRHFPSLLVGLIGPDPGKTDSEARASAAAFEGDLRFGWNMWAWARLAAEAGRGKVYAYRFSRAPPFRSGDRYFGLAATHGMEMPYVFDHLDQQSVAWVPEDRRLAEAMPAYWTNFARSGDPNGAGLPPWPQFTQRDRQVLLLGDEIAARPAPGEERLKRIDRTYAMARFIMRNVYVACAAVALVVIAPVVIVVIAIRRRRRRRLSGAGGIQP